MTTHCWIFLFCDTKTSGYLTYILLLFKRNDQILNIFFCNPNNFKINYSKNLFSVILVTDILLTQLSIQGAPEVEIIIL